MSQETDPTESFFQELGFIEERCPHCQARMYGGQAGPTCLNGCFLSGHLYRKLIWKDLPAEPKEGGS